MRKIWAILAWTLFSWPLFAQSIQPVTGYCNLGGSHASVSGLLATNFQQGIIPGCTVSVYLHGTQSLATIFADSNSTPLSNPFTAVVSASPNSGSWIFWAASGQAYDVVGSGGAPPITYPAPVTLTEVYLVSGGGGSTHPCGVAGDVQINYPFGVFGCDTAIFVEDPVTHTVSDTNVTATSALVAGSVATTGSFSLRNSNAAQMQQGTDAPLASYGFDWPNSAPVSIPAYLNISSLTPNADGRLPTLWSTISGGSGCVLTLVANTSIISRQGGNCYGDLDWIYNPGSAPYIQLGGASGKGEFEIDEDLSGHNETVFQGTWFDQESRFPDGEADLITYDNSQCQFSAGNSACNFTALNIQNGNSLSENGVQAIEADVGSGSAASNDLTSTTMSSTHSNTNPNKVVEGLQVKATSSYSGSKVFALELNASGGIRPVSLYADSVGGGTPHLPADGFHYDFWSENNTLSNTSQIGGYFGNDLILQPNAGGEASCSGNSSNVIVSSAIDNGGGGYAVNDTFTIASGTGGTGIVDAVNGGVVLNFHITNAGTGYSDGIKATTATLGVGAGLTLNISVDPPSRGRIHYKNAGSGSPDTLEYCGQGSGGSYGWQALGTGGGTVTSVSGTTNQIDSTGGTTPVISLDSAIQLPGSLTAGNGASITVSGTGTNNANRVNGASIPISKNVICTNSSGQIVGSGGVCVVAYGFAFQGAVGASATGLIQVNSASTLPANLATPTTTCKCGTNPTSSFAITLKDGGSTVGTITLNSSCSATLATTGGTTQSLAADDQLYAIAPGSADATAANISCLVRATRN